MPLDSLLIRSFRVSEISMLCFGFAHKERPHYRNIGKRVFRIVRTRLSLLRSSKMSRNRAFRLLKDARLRASATSVGGTSSRVGQTVTRSADLARCA